MSPVEGNAWAQMKAKERAQRKSDPDRGKYSLFPSLFIDNQSSPTPTKSRKSSGLDYDAELALPMPKPRHVRQEAISYPNTKPHMLAPPNVTKKRSTTEPNLNTEGSSKSASEKKKSKVATLRSKFSLKDLGKEFRKEIPPFSIMPKLDGGSGNEVKCASSDDESQSRSTHNFNEARLYVPKTRKEDVQPSSAPPQTTHFRQASLDKKYQDSISSCPSIQTPTKSNDDAQTAGQFKHSLIHSTDSGQSTTNTPLDTMLFDGSSPPASTGECNNSGQPELVQVQPRVFSMKAENTEFTLPYAPQTPPPPPHPPVDTSAYSPSVYNTPKKVAAKASETSLFEKKESQKITHPLIVSSSSYKGKALDVQAEDQLFMAPQAPPYPPIIPSKAKAREEQRDNHNHIATDEGQVFAGITSHGGFAPPPPHPSYQNTVTLEQQLATHVESLHYHINTAVHKLHKTCENSNNWTTDQILRQVDSVYDLARVINARSVAQAETVKELPRLIMDARIQINLVQQETIQVENRMRGFVQQELAKLKSDLSELILANAGVSGGQQGSKSSGLDQGSQGGPRPPRDGDKRSYQNKRKSRQMPVKREDSTFNKPTDNKNPAAEQNLENKPAPVQQADTAKGSQIDEQCPSDNVPTPTAAFRTPKPQHNDATPAPAHRSVLRNPGKETCGSPESKGAKLQISGPLPLVEGSQKQSLESNRASTLQRESDSKPRSAFSSEDLKTPKKKGMWSSFRRNGDNDSRNRFLRTPRRTKEGKSANSQESQSPRLPISTPTATSTSSAASTKPPSTTAIAGGQIHRGDSPSIIHPALRDPHQKQIMLDREGERERRLAQLNPHSHIHPLRTSHSHQSFGAKASGSVSPPPPSFTSYDPTPGYAPGISMSTSSSTASFHGVRHCQSSTHYPHSSSASGPLPPPPQGQPQHYFAPHPVHPQPLLPGPDLAHGHGPGPGPGPSYLSGQYAVVDWYGHGNGSLEHDVGYPVGNFI
ncbi:hypothetical protein BDW59DRAFT_171706 [Aspergillus cavernicola]|uniref:Uncharacterized protein n=1 Tax=Aspergillus cavernicola TaxID=176166 RepID=A0ABR4IH81_9EURO